MEADLVKMSPKGQLVVPQEIREDSSFNPGDRFVAFPVKEGVVFKKINLKEEFDKVSKEIASHFKKRGISSRDVRDGIKWARKR